MNRKDHNIINQTVYLYLIKKFGVINEKFLDSLVQIYYLMRTATEIKIDRTFVSYDFKIVDGEQQRILENLRFYQFINQENKITELGNEFLNNILEEKIELQNVIKTFEDTCNDNTAYNNTCLSPTSPTTANCGICKNMNCTQKTSFLRDVLLPRFKLPNFQKSFSKQN
ncbi:hypothetical protein [Bacillus toyonensis]|uniref:hypothetical protein n=1 Tax=Bacillus toyonensis TaxID=155322 RepID=UPI002E249D3B|nr:hypothetical protein [Bacillus toyonensis]